MFVEKSIKQYFDYIYKTNRTNKSFISKSSAYKRLEKYKKEIIPCLWNNFVKKYIEVSKYFSVEFSYNRSPFAIESLSNESKQFIEENEIVFDEKPFFKVNNKIIQYVKRSKFEDWYFMHPEDLILFDSDKNKLIEVISHEWIIYLFFNQEEVDMINLLYPRIELVKA